MEGFFLEIHETIEKLNNNLAFLIEPRSPAPHVEEDMLSAAERQKAGLLKKAAQESRKRLGKNAQSRFGRF